MYLQLFLLHLGTTSLQTRAKLQKSIKGVLNCCKLQVILKIQNKLCNYSCFKDPIHRTLTLSVVTSFSVEYAMNHITENVLDTLQ